jgi:hypothetical protein
VFPSAGGLPRRETDVEFALAMVALEEGFRFTQLFGLDLLFNHFRRGRAA